MQGSKKPFIVIAMAGMSLSGCVVHQHQAPQPPEQQQQPPQPQAVRSASPATRNAAVPKPPAPTPAAPAPATPAPQPAAGGRSYTIKPGDNLWNISKEIYGDGTKYQRIIDANPGLNPDNMKPGTKIVIP